MRPPAARRLVVKVGSALVASEHGPHEAWMAGLAADVANLLREGREVILVSSGAVALGRRLLDLPRSARLDQKQAAAAAGQPLLMQAWSTAFAASAIPTAQLLLTARDTEQRRSFLNARATVEALLKAGALPIINENDSTATAELRVGDNDRLSARVAQLAGAELLVLLSDVDGLHSADPRLDQDAEHISVVKRVTPDILALAGGSAAEGVGTGGMRTKLEAARIAASAGCATLIGDGRASEALTALLCAKAKGTLVLAEGTPASSYKAWIAGTLAPSGTILIDEGAAHALRRGGSLLPSGVLSAEGGFRRGDCVKVIAPGGEEVARGLARYDVEEAVRIVGLRGADIEGRLGYSRGHALIHRDDLVLR